MAKSGGKINPGTLTGPEKMASSYFSTFSDEKRPDTAPPLWSKAFPQPNLACARTFSGTAPHRNWSDWPDTYDTTGKTRALDRFCRSLRSGYSVSRLFLSPVVRVLHSLSIDSRTAASSIGSRKKTRIHLGILSAGLSKVYRPRLFPM